MHDKDKREQDFFIRNPDDDHSSPIHDFRYFERHLADLREALVQCQSEQQLQELQARIDALTAAWEQVYIHSGPISPSELRSLITLREERLRPLLRSLQRRFGPLP